MEIIAILIGLLLLCALLLALPVDLGFYLKKDETFDYRAELCLLFGLVTVDMAKNGGGAEKTVLPKKQKREKTLPVSLLRNRRFIRRLIRLMQDILHSFQIKELRAHWRIGLGDPADTGMLLGLLQPLLLRGKSITLNADFQETVFEGYCKARIRLFPIRIIGYLLAFAFSSSTVGAVKSSLARQGD